MQGRVITGFRLEGHSRLSELGTWTNATAPDGRPAGALQFDPRLVADPGARQRLVEAVTTDRRLVQSGLTGLLPIEDLVAAGTEVWLLTGRPAAPTVTDLLNMPSGGPIPDAGSVAAILVETAQTLLALHTAGLAHGAVHPGTVVIGEDGATLLAERGLINAVRGLTPEPHRDVTAWASLARGLAASWASRAPELFEQAAATALTRGLAAARDTLLANRDRLPGGQISRERLRGTVQWWQRHNAPAAVAPAQPEVIDEGEIVTLLHVPSQGRPGVPPTPRGEVRFGPGVPTETTAEQIWRSGRQQATVHARQGRLSGRVAARRRGRTIIATALFAVILAGAALAWVLRGSGGPPLVVEKVSVKAPRKTQGCDSTVTISGVITTNGSDGQVRYEWRRSDGSPPVEQVETVRAGTTSYPVVLRWTVKGQGVFKGTATLRVISPVPNGKRIQDRASFTYRCR